MTAARRVSLRTEATAWALTLLAWLWVALLHQGLGPPRGRAEWLFSQPSGFLLEWLGSSSFAPVGEDVRLGVLLLSLPAAALALAVGFVTRKPVTRVAALAAVVSCALFAFYGIQAPVVWAFFGWRWSASMVAFAAIAAAAALAPLLAARWLHLGWPARLALYLPVFAALVVLERNVTGTDPTLRLAISPWPAVQIFGLEVTAATLAALLLGVAAGLAILELSPERPAWLRLGAAVTGAAAAGGFPAGSLYLGSLAGLLPFQADARLLGGTAAAAALAYVAASWNAAGLRRRRRTRVWAVAAVGVGLPLLVGLTLTRVDYVVTREERAASIIGGLEAHLEREGEYPDDLEQLVAAGDLDEIPRPRIGFSALADPEFVYQGFGTSFLLEFSAPRWIQCAYSPPYEDELEEPEDALEESWSCPARPPELW